VYNTPNKLVIVYLGGYTMLIFFKLISCIAIGGMIYFLIGLISQNKKILEMFEKLLGR